MSNLNLRDNENLQKLLHLSCKLVVLQNLKACYDYELETELPQETRNFRSACILDEIKLILDRNIDYVEWIANVQMGTIDFPDEHLEGVNKIVKDLDFLYNFVLEEAAKKEARIRLMELENKMFNEK